MKNEKKNLFYRSNVFCTFCATVFLMINHIFNFIIIHLHDSAPPSAPVWMTAALTVSLSLHSGGTSSQTEGWEDSSCPGKNQRSSGEKGNITSLIPTLLPLLLTCLKSQADSASITAVSLYSTDISHSEESEMQGKVGHCSISFHVSVCVWAYACVCVCLCSSEGKERGP